MKKILASVATLTAIVAATPAFAQAGSPSSANAGASAEIVIPIAITKTRDMSFGTIAANGSAGQVRTGSASDANLLIASSAAPASATFGVTGQGTLAYTVTVPPSVQLASGANNMTADLTLVGAASRSLVAGADSVEVNGNLNVGATQAAGNYTGSFSVSVRYN